MASPNQNPTIAVRVAIIGACLLVLFGIVFFRLWYLQVLAGPDLAQQAAHNRKRSTPITPPRGNIVDRAGEVIVQNKRVSVLELAPNSLPDVERTAALEYGQKLGTWYARPEAQRRVTARPALLPLNSPKVAASYEKAGEVSELPRLVNRYQRLAKLLGVSSTEIRRRVINSYYLAPYAPAPLEKNVSSDVANYVFENQDSYPGVSLTQRFVRSYPQRGIGAQLLGQVGPVPVDDKSHKSAIPKYAKLNPATLVGLSGLEYEYNSELAGRAGSVQANIDAQGDVVGTPKIVPPAPGRTLQLTLDSRLERVAQDAISAGSQFNPGGNPAAAIAMDPRTGAVLASVSNPTYNPNVFANISQSAFDALTDPNGPKPLFNRVLAGAYPAGSTFKPITAFAELSSGVGTPDELIEDPGSIKISDRTYQNAGKEPNGQIALQRAIQVSSDVYFYTMGARMNTVKGLPLQTWARRLGYGQKTGVDLPGERAGVIPDPKWRIGLNDLERPCRIKRHIQLTPGTFGCGYSDMRTWSIGDEVGLAVGQGDLQITPLQSAVLYSAIENGGTIVTPHFGSEVLSADGEVVQHLPSKPRRKVQLDPTALATVRRGLYDAANEPGGTSQPVFANWPRGKYPVYGKTGTAERGANIPDQAWYAAYVPGNHPIVVVATVEAGGFGATTAAPIVAQIMRAWYHLDGVQIKAGTSSTR